MSLVRSFLRLRKRNRKLPPIRNKVYFEPLEPRVLLSDFTYGAAAGAALNATLQLQKIGDVDTLQLIDNTDPSIILESQALADTSAVLITGAEQDDRLKIDLDFDALFDPLPISFSGGEGNDTLDFSEIEDNLLFVNRQTGDMTITNGEFTVNGDGTVSIAGGTSSITGTDVENLVGGQGDNAYIFEDGAILAGTIDGGTNGNNTLDYSPYSSSNPVVVDLSSGIAMGTAGVSHLYNVIGGSGNDALTGTSGDNILSGGPGNDILNGLGGEDILTGDEGDDTLMGPATDNTWDITGANEGLLNKEAEFSGIENLVGGANNQDGVVFFAAGPSVVAGEVLMDSLLKILPKRGHLLSSIRTAPAQVPSHSMTRQSTTPIWNESLTAASPVQWSSTAACTMTSWCWRMPMLVALAKCRFGAHRVISSMQILAGSPAH